MIVLGVILILIFSSINHGLSQTIDIPTLNELWSRPSWLAWFAFSIVFNGVTYFVSHVLASLLASRASFSPLPSPTIRVRSTNPVVSFFTRARGSWRSVERAVVARAERMFMRSDDARLVWLQGIGWGVCGGTLAGLCLVFTKAVVKIFWLPGHPVSPAQQSGPVHQADDSWSIPPPWSPSCWLSLPRSSKSCA